MTERNVLIEKLPSDQLMICLFYFLHKQVDDKDDERSDNTDVNTYDKIEQLWV